MKFSERQIAALTEIIRLGMGQGAGVLNAMLASQVTLQVAHVRVLALDQYLMQLGFPGSDHVSAVQLGYQGSFAGKVLLVFPTVGASKLVTMLTDEALDSDDFDLIQAGTLSEVGNIVINGVMGTLSNILGQYFVYSVPTYLEEQADHLLCAPDRENNHTLLLARTRFTLETQQIEGDLLLSFEPGAMETMVEALGALMSDE